MAKRRRQRKKSRKPALRKRDEYLESGQPVAIPDCQHQNDCGGCTWQRIPYSQQRSWKIETIRSAFAEEGFSSIPLSAFHSSPDLYRYRNQMEFSFARRPWVTRRELVSGREFSTLPALGLHVPGGIGRVLNLESCSLQNRTAAKAFDIVRSFVDESGHLGWDHRSHEGYWRFLKIRYASERDELLLGVVTSTRDPELMRALGDRLAEGLTSQVVLTNGVSARIGDTSEGAEWFVDRGEGTVFEVVDGLEFELGPESFFQPNSRAASLIFSEVLRMAQLDSSHRVLDLFCGAGAISLFLARHAQHVDGFEIVAPAIECARRNAERNRLDNTTFEVADLMKGLPMANEATWDVMVSDPPRAGMHKKLIDALVTVGSNRFVSVGCNPVTQARDLKRLVEEGGYRIIDMVGVDQFPHTPHVENVVLLERDSRPA